MHTAELLMTVFIQQIHLVKKNQFADTVSAKTGNAEAVENVLHYAVIILNISVQSFLNLHMYVTVVLINTDAALKKGFTRRKKLRKDTKNCCLNQ